MIDDRILPWTQDQETQGYPVWTSWEALQRTVFFLNTMGEIDTSFNITPYDPNSPEDFAYIKNMILELRDTTQHNLIAVPHDYPTIQEGIDAATSGDTVLVSPGIYFENIDFNGKNIAVIGEDRETTIIDGNYSGSVVKFENGEDSTTVLVGFTIQNGYAFGNNWNGGGGIYCDAANPTLSNLIIKDNYGYNGGGIYSLFSDQLIENIILKYNTAQSKGGGIAISSGNPVIVNSIIFNNYSDYGGGLYCVGSPEINNVTIVDNIANKGGTITVQGGIPKIINSIMRNDAPEEIYFLSISTLIINYSNIENGQTSYGGDSTATIIWGDGNIDADPFFTDPYNGVFTLQSTSPCIDSGHPDLDGDGFTWEIDPDDRDPDGTRIDMGAFYHHHSAGDYPISVSYNEGWNMVGLPLLVEDGHYQSLFNSIYSGSLYNFDGMYIVEEYLDEGLGYLLRFTADTQVTFEGTHILDINIPVESGWNLISGISTLTSVDEVYSSSIIYPGTIYGFEGTYINADYIVPGRGYWARAMHEGEIILSSTNPTIKMIEQVDRLSGSNTLKFSNGYHSTTLFFGKDVPKGETLNYSLPPIFPQMPFDARFSGNTKVVLESGTIEVLNQLETLTVDYDIKIVSGNQMNWVLISDDGVLFILEGTGKFTVLSGERFTLDRISQLPKTIKLNQNFPNPFNNKTSIHYYIPINTHVNIQIFDLNGVLVKRLINKNQLAGYHKVKWNGQGRNNNIVSSGIYIYKLNTKRGQSLTGKCIFLK